MRTLRVVLEGLLGVLMALVALGDLVKIAAVAQAGTAASGVVAGMTVGLLVMAALAFFFLRDAVRLWRRPVQ